MTPALPPHPLIEQLLARCEVSKLSRTAIAARAGVYENALGIWAKGKGMPGLAGFDAVAQVVGLKLVLVPIDEAEIPVPDAKLDAARAELRAAEASIARLRRMLSDLKIDKNG